MTSIVAGDNAGYMRFYTAHSPLKEKRLKFSFRVSLGAISAIAAKGRPPNQGRWLAFASEDRLGLVDARFLGVTDCPPYEGSVTSLAFHSHLEEILYVGTTYGISTYYIKQGLCQHIGDLDLGTVWMAPLRGYVLTLNTTHLSAYNTSIHCRSRIPKYVTSIDSGQASFIFGNSVSSLILAGHDGAMVVHSKLPSVPYDKEPQSRRFLFMMSGILLFFGCR